MAYLDPYIEDSMNQFIGSFYGTALAEQNANYVNIFISPLSIFVAMAMTWAGSVGITATNMAQVLRLPCQVSSYDVHSSIGSIAFSAMEPNSGVNTTLANRLFLFKNVSIYPEYQNILDEYYQAQLQEINTGTDYEAARTEVNNWVSNQTRGKIAQLMPEGSINELTLLTIVNALYFKGKWETPFKPENTNEAPFYGLDGTNTTIKLMFRKGKVPYMNLSDIDAQAVKIPFDGINPNWSMLVVLPNRNDGLGKVLSYLAQPGNLTQLVTTPFTESEILLYLPKFKIGEGTALDAKRILKSMGMKQVFSPSEANLSNIGDVRDLFVSDVVHKAILEVDEFGATAAAATGVSVGVTSVQEIPEFRTDRPFFLALVSDNRIPVFLGHVVQMNKSG